MKCSHTTWGIVGWKKRSTKQKVCAGALQMKSDSMMMKKEEEEGLLAEKLAEESSPTKWDSVKPSS